MLVHGAWHGGWCWWKVVPLLRSHGHEVYAPSLTGLGDRAHLLSPTVDLETHIRDIVSLMEFEDLTNVILVGHSYGGMVIAGVAEQVPRLVKHLVYLDAVTPKNRQSLSDLYPDTMKMLRKKADEKGEEWRLFCPADWTFGIAEPDLTWVKSRLRPQPAATFEQKVNFSKQEALALPKTFIWCNSSGVGESRSARDDWPSLPTSFPRGWGFHEIKTGHDAMITVPKELTDILLGVVGEAAG